MHKTTTKETTLFFIAHAWRYPWFVIALLIVTPITVIVHQFLPPIIAASVLERLSSGKFIPNDIWGSFGNDLMWYTAVSILGAIVAWRITIWISWQLELRVIRDIDRRVFSHLLGQSAQFHANHFGGSLVTQANKLSKAYIKFADTTIYELITLVTAFIFSSIILWPRVPMLVIFMILLSVGFMVMAFFITRIIRRLQAAEAEANNRQTGFLADVITNIGAVKSFAGGPYETRRYNKAIEDWRGAERRVLYATLKQQVAFASFTTTLGIAAIVLAVASVVVFKADVATVFLVLTFTTNIGQRLWEFSQHTLRDYNRSMADAKAMVEILNQEPSVKDPARPEPSRIAAGDIVINHVDFTHNDAHKDDVLFKNLTIHIKAGTKVGLVGHSGSGKTTLTKLLLRFADIDRGAITIDGQNIAHITQDDLRRSIAYVPQEPLLFHRSLRENIAYGKLGATDEDIRRAARRAHAAEFIEKLPRGYETEVGERGVKLSGGQRQRIAIARAMLKNAPILVLDEATSALDSESERLIQSALWELMKDRTAIVIAHRLSTVQKMDHIIVLDNGRIVEQGTHQTLLAAHGTYASLWAHQSGGFIEE